MFAPLPFSGAHIIVGRVSLSFLPCPAPFTLIDDVTTAIYHFNGFMRKFLSNPGMPRARVLVSWAMIVLWPLSSLAADTQAAVLHTRGGVFVNGAEAVDSSPVFPGDRVEARPGFVADLDMEGSSVLIQPESILKFQGTYIELEHGSISVGTSASMGVHVSCLQVEPISKDRTEYEVTDRTGSVDVKAVKNDLNFTESGPLKKISQPKGQSQSSILHAGEQQSRQESSCGRGSEAPKAGSQFPTKWVAIGGGAAGVIALCLVFCKGSSNPPASQSEP
jgi:hypothetical protein